MDEGKEVKLITRGMKRAAYLDEANVAWATGDIDKAGGYCDAFIEDLPDDTEASKELFIELENILKRKQYLTKILIEDMKGDNALVRSDKKINGENFIKYKEIQQKKLACFTVMNKYKLYQDKTLVEYDI